jgi:uncharacterized protein (DUF2235 family)
MSKNIVLCCDGTASEFAQDNTNVIKLFFTLDQDPNQQVTYYHPGLGTMEPAGALTPVAELKSPQTQTALARGAQTRNVAPPATRFPPIAVFVRSTGVLEISNSFRPAP